MKSLRLPLLLFVLPAVLLACFPSHHDLLLLDRSALTAGQVWRLWTGHWVHFSPSHLFWNLVVLVAAGSWLEMVRPGLLLRHTLVAVPCISLVILAFEPGLQAYGGLSALATAVVVLLGLQQLHAHAAPRWLWMGVLGLVAVKTMGDTRHTGPLLATFSTPAVRASTSAHAAGALVALLHYIYSRCPGYKMTPPGLLTGSRR